MTLALFSALPGAVRKSLVAPVTPALGTPVVMAAENITANSDPHVSTTPIITTSGQGVLIHVLTRNNGNPGSDFLDATLTPDVGSPVVMTLIDKAKLGGAGRNIIAAYWARNLAAATWDLSVDMDSGSNRDFVAIGVTVDGMEPTSTPVGAEDATSVNTSDTEITQSITPPMAGARLMAFVGFGVGDAALNYTGIGGTRIAQASTGNAGTNADISGALVTSVAADTDPLNIGASASVSDDDRAIVRYALVTS